jgi:hypothetical protein
LDKLELNDNDFIAKKVESNWNKFRALCSKLGDRSESILEMLDYFEDVASIAPASSRSEFHGSYPGGFVDHSLRVLSNLNKLIKAYEFQDKFSKETMIVAALFHDWGKVGDLEGPRYVDQDSDWHLRRGINYNINNDLQYMSTSQRSLWLMQHFGIKLTRDEYLAILLNDGMYASENKSYGMNEPLLAVLVHQADRMACHFEKGKTSL